MSVHRLTQQSIRRSPALRNRLLEDLTLDEGRSVMVEVLPALSGGILSGAIFAYTTGETLRPNTVVAWATRSVGTSWRPSRPGCDALHRPTVNVFVDPAWRRQAIGTLLTEACLAGTSAPYEVRPWDASSHAFARSIARISQS